MKINPVNHIRQNSPKGKISPAFGKRVLDSVNIRKAMTGIDYVNFVKYDMLNPKDRQHFINLSLGWGKKAEYIDFITSSINSVVQRFFEKYRPSLSRHHFFGLEDKMGKTLAVSEVVDEGKRFNILQGRRENRLNIYFLQANPDEMYASATKQYKGVGETLVSKIVEIAENEGRDSIVLESHNENFWNSSGLFEDCGLHMPDGVKKRLHNNDFGEYIEKVHKKIVQEYSAKVGGRQD